MGLRALAETHLGLILENQSTGFGWPITVTDPSGNQGSLVGSSADISQSIDPETGVIVSGRLATVALRIGALADAGLGIPEGISDNTSKPWLVQFDDINGNAYTFKVAQSNPDRTIGCVYCRLEGYTE